MNVEQLMRELADKTALLEQQRQENRRLIEQRIGYQRHLDVLQQQQADTDARNAQLTEQLAVTEQKVELLEREVDVLMRRITVLTRMLARARHRDEKLALELEIDALQKRVNALHADTFASKSERRPREGKPKKKRAKQKGHGPTPQPNLPRREVRHTLDQADQCCPSCGGELAEWAGQFESAEEITVVARRYEIAVHQRQKYKCRGCDHIDTALGPPRLIPGGRYSPAFGVEVAIDKYCDHLPLARQVKRMARSGLVVTTATLWDQLFALYVLLAHNVVALHEQILQSRLVHADETTWPLLGRGKTKKWWVWLVRSEVGAYFLIAPGRGQASGRELLRDYAGVVMADDYSVYTALEKERSSTGPRQVEVDGEFIAVPTPDFTLASCWSHIRRPFIKARKVGDLAADGALDLIGELYRIESEAEAEASSFAELLAIRRRLRSGRSAEVLSRLRSWCAEQSPLPGSHLEQGIAHLLRVWDRAVVFLKAAVVPLDNNPAERDLRGVVLGRKNFQGSRSERGTRVAALFYSLITSCKIVGVDPAAYLREAVRRATTGDTTPFLPTHFRDSPTP